MMELLEKHRDASKGRQDKAATPAETSGSLDYLSTHPATAERIRRAREYR
jgi:Zn-dependent protease with chaperone function